MTGAIDNYCCTIIILEYILLVASAELNACTLSRAVACVMALLTLYVLTSTNWVSLRVLRYWFPVDPTNVAYRYTSSLPLAWAFLFSIQWYPTSQSSSDLRAKRVCFVVRSLQGDTVGALVVVSRLYLDTIGDWVSHMWCCRQDTS